MESKKIELLKLKKDELLRYGQDISVTLSKSNTKEVLVNKILDKLYPKEEAPKKKPTKVTKATKITKEDEVKLVKKKVTKPAEPIEEGEVKPDEPGTKKVYKVACKALFRGKNCENNSIEKNHNAYCKTHTQVLDEFKRSKQSKLPDYEWNEAKKLYIKKGDNIVVDFCNEDELILSGVYKDNKITHDYSDEIFDLCDKLSICSIKAKVIYEKRKRSDKLIKNEE